MSRSPAPGGRGTVARMLQDLAALTPPLIVCVAFLVGVGLLVRRELAPRRQARREAGRSQAVRSLPGAGTPGRDSAASPEAETPSDRGDGSQT
jgi:hypothetical protein